MSQSTWRMSGHGGDRHLKDRCAVLIWNVPAAPDFREPGEGGPTVPWGAGPAQKLVPES